MDLMVKIEDVIKLVEYERDSWDSSGQDCMGAESACEHILAALAKLKEVDTMSS